MRACVCVCQPDQGSSVYNINHMHVWVQSAAELGAEIKGKSNEKVEEKQSITPDATAQNRNGIWAFSFHTAHFAFSSLALLFRLNMRTYSL